MSDQGVGGGQAGGQQGSEAGQAAFGTGTDEQGGNGGQGGYGSDPAGQGLPDGVDANTLWQFAYDTWTKSSEAAYGSALQQLTVNMLMAQGMLYQMGANVAGRSRIDDDIARVSEDIERVGEAMQQLSGALEAQDWRTVDWAAANLRRCISNLDLQVAMNIPRSVTGQVRDIDWVMEGVVLSQLPRLTRALLEPADAIYRALAMVAGAGTQAAAATAAVLTIDPVGQAAQMGDQPHEDENGTLLGEVNTLWGKLSSFRSQTDSMADENDAVLRSTGSQYYGGDPSSTLSIEEARGDASSPY
ncbi:MAG TPA: hypothetical protein VF855_00285 [Acidimicrobiales bacterium]